MTYKLKTLVKKVEDANKLACLIGTKTYGVNVTINHFFALKRVSTVAQLNKAAHEEWIDSFYDEVMNMGFKQEDGRYSNCFAAMTSKGETIEVEIV